VNLSKTKTTKSNLWCWSFSCSLAKTE